MNSRHMAPCNAFLCLATGCCVQARHVFCSASYRLLLQARLGRLAQRRHPPASTLLLILSCCLLRVLLCLLCSTEGGGGGGDITCAGLPADASADNANP